MVEFESFNPVLLFICRLCRRTFRDTDTLKSHKLENHEKDCEGIKCIIFEERFLDQRWVPLNDTYTCTIQHVRNSNSDRKLDSGIGVASSSQHVNNVCVSPSSPSLPVSGGSPSSLCLKRPSPSKKAELNPSEMKSTDNHPWELRRRDERTINNNVSQSGFSSLSKSAHVDIEANYDSPLLYYQETKVDGTSGTGELDQVKISKGSPCRRKHITLSESEEPAISPTLTSLSPPSTTFASSCERYPTGTATLTTASNSEEHSFPNEDRIVTKSVLRSSGVTVTFDLAVTKPIKPSSELLKRNNKSRTFFGNLDVNRDINAGSGFGSGSGNDAEFNRTGTGSNCKLQVNTEPEPDTGRIGSCGSDNNNIKETNENQTGNMKSHVLVLPVPFPAPGFPESKPAEHENLVFFTDCDYAFEEVVETSSGNIITDEEEKRISAILSGIGNSNSAEEPVSSVNEILDVDLIEDVFKLIYDASIEAESMGLHATVEQDQQDQLAPLDLSVSANVKVISTTPDFTPNNVPTHSHSVVSESPYVEHSPPPASATTSSAGAADTCITNKGVIGQPRKQKSRKIAKLSQEDTIATITPAEPQRSNFSRIFPSAASHSLRISRNSGSLSHDRTGRKRTSDRLKVFIENHRRRKLCRKVNETDATSKSNSDDSDDNSIVPKVESKVISTEAQTCEWKMKLRGSRTLFNNKNKALNTKTSSDRIKSSGTKSSAKHQQNPSVVGERIRKSTRAQKEVQVQSLSPRESRHYCKSCNRTFSDSTQLKDHGLKFHSRRKFKCRECKKEFFDKKCYVRHEKSHRMNLKNHVCQVEGCSASFFFKSHLAQHMEVHTLVKPYKCPSCPLEFKRQRGLESHLVRHGSELKCLYCAKVFGGKTSLENHERTHTGDKPFKCKVSTCQLTFISSYTRAMHYRVKHFNELGLEQFQCTMCRKFRKYRAFGTQRLLDAHVFSQHSAVKPFNCSHPGCTKGYLQKRTLIDHERSHTGENPFICVKCGKGFPGKSALGRHRRRWIGGNCII